MRKDLSVHEPNYASHHGLDIGLLSVLFCATMKGIVCTQFSGVSLWMERARSTGCRLAGYISRLRTRSSACCEANCRILSRLPRKVFSMHSVAYGYVDQALRLRQEKRSWGHSIWKHTPILHVMED